jgi:hypothetical protein
MLVVSP